MSREHGFYSEELIQYLVDGGSLQDRDDVPDEYKELFKVSADIDPQHHVAMQAVFSGLCGFRGV